MTSYPGPVLLPWLLGRSEVLRMRFKVSTHLTILQNASQQNNNKELWACSFNYLWEIKDLLNTQALLTTLQQKMKTTGLTSHCHARAEKFFTFSRTLFLTVL